MVPASHCLVLHPPFQMASSESDVSVDAVGPEVHSSGSEESGEPAAKEPHRAPRGYRRRGHRMTVRKRMAQFLEYFFKFLETQIGDPFSHGLNGILS